MESSNTALDGLMVLDLTRVVAGPLCGQMLGDLGATVIKVEKPGTGDELRRVGPPFMANAAGESTYFQIANRNKRAISINFADQRGADLLRSLVSRCDILLENYRPGTLAAYGLGYEDLIEINPRLIYCSITGFGQTGPYSERSGYDYVVQGMAGAMSVTGKPGDGPTRVGLPIADFAASQNASIGVLAALAHRNRCGKGQHVDIALFDTQLAMMLNVFSGWFNADTFLGLTGNDHPSACPHGVYPTADGHIIIATFTDGEFGRLADALGHPEWKADPRFARNRDRVANREDLGKALSEVLMGERKAFWIERLVVANVPAGPINEMSDIEHDPQVAARDMVVELPYWGGGTVRTIGNPIKLTESPASYGRRAPMYGEHTDEILSELLGLGAEEIGSLRAAKVI
ncbi:MAG: CoA-transferase [Bradyrhizobium sp.]|nr:CoA-transferase [Bradyrhizobium sp.]